MNRNALSRRLLIILLFSLVVFHSFAAGKSDGVLAGPSSAAAGVRPVGLPVVDAPITLKGMVSAIAIVGDWNGHAFAVELAKRTNINVQWESIPDSAFVEKRNLAFASNMLPDFIIRARLTAEEEAKYAAAQQIIPLENLMKDWAPNLNKIMKENPGIYKNIVLPDGHVYSLPQLNKTEGNLIDNNWINKVWLDKLGLKMPTTIDEFYTVLVAFKTRDPNGNGKADELAYSIGKANAVELMTNFFGVWGFGKNNGIVDRFFDIDDTGKIRALPTDPRFKEMLSFFNRLWTEKLLDNEVFSMKTGQMAAKIEADTVGFANQGNNNNWIGDNFRNNYVQPPAFKSKYSDGIWTNILPFVQQTGTFVITSVNKHPEATMRMVDYLYSEEGTVMVRFGIEGKSYEKTTAGYKLLPNILKDPTGLSQDQAISKWAVYYGGNVPQFIIDSVDSSPAQRPDIKATTEILRPALVPYDNLPRLKFTEDETIKLGRVATDIRNFVNENTVKFLTGERSLTEYDRFVSELNGMKLDEYKAVLQASFDRWKKF